MSKQLSIYELRDLINNGEANDPIVFLESVMNGQDPRKFSGIYKLIMEIDDFTDGDLSKEEWSELVDYAMNHSKYHTVPLDQSIGASKTLAEYLHPKRKQIEMTGGMGHVNVEDNPLTEEEIELFKEKFNDEF